MSVIWTWHGAVTPTSVRVRARVEGEDTTLLVTDAEGSQTSYGPETPDDIGMVTVSVEGLAPDRRYSYRWETDGDEHADFEGTFRTAPPDDGSPQDFTFMAAGDAGLEGASAGSEYITDGISDNPVFDVMRRRALAEDHVGFVHIGDAWYRDEHEVDLDAFRDTYDDLLTFNGERGHRARQGRFFRSINLALGADDHDLMDNNTDRTSRGRDNYLLTYREHAPHYPLPAGEGAEGIYQSWQWGRVLFVHADVRADRDPNRSFGDRDKTMLGAAQKRWMEHVLANSSAQALVWVLPSMWLSDQGNTRNAGIGYSGADYSTDSYRMFRHERDELVQLFGDTGWLDRMVCLQADKHALSMSSGPNNPHGGFPLMMFASMDAGFSANPEGQYDLGQSPGRQRYGTVRVRDSGHTIAMQGTGYVMDQVWRTHTAYAHVEPRVLQVNYARGEVFDPFQPVDDDQQLVNHFTASRTDGEEYEHELTDGPLSVQDPPHGAGRYSGSATLNVPSDAELPDQAGWHVHKGTVDAPRFPAVGFVLHNPRMADLREDLADLDTGDRINVEDPPPWLPPEAIGMIAQGYEERINTHEWEITYNASPAEQVEVARVAPAQILNFNHSFEINTGGWEGTGVELARDDAHSYRGTYSLRALPDNGSDQVSVATRLQESPRVYPGREYEFSAWVRTVHPDVAVGMTVDWYDAEGEEISGPIVYPETPSPEQEWWQAEGLAVAPAHAHRMQWHIYQVATEDADDALDEDTPMWVDQATMGPSGVDAGPAEPNRVDTSGSHLVVPVDEDETDLWVHTDQSPTSGARWINSRGPTFTHEQQFPYDISVGGETMRVTGAEPGGHDLFRTERPEGEWGTSEQGLTWSSVTSEPTEIGTDPQGQYGYMRLLESTQTIRLQHLELYGPLTDCEILWSVRINVEAEGASAAPALLIRRTSNVDLYRCRVHLQPQGTVALSITRGTNQVGQTVPVTGLTYQPGRGQFDRLFVRTRLIGDRVLARAWRPAQDIADLPDEHGLDLAYQEPYTWHIDRTIEDDPIEAGQIGFAASTFEGWDAEEPPELRFQLLEVVTPQRFRVERSVNGVTKEHPAGEGIALAHPAIIGL